MVIPKMPSNIKIKVARTIIPTYLPLFSIAVRSTSRAMLLGNWSPNDRPISEASINAVSSPFIKARSPVDRVPSVIENNSNFFLSILLLIRAVITVETAPNPKSRKFARKTMD